MSRGRLTKYIWIARTSIRSNLAYFGEVAARIVFLGVILYIFLQLWKLTYSEMHAETLGGLTLAQMLWYLAISEAITLSTPPVAPEIDQDVRTGTIAVHLLKPMSYPFYRLWSTLGERAVRFTLNAVVGAAIVLAFVGPIPMSLQGFGFFLLSIPLAFVLDFLAYLIIGLAAFWLENTTGLVVIYSRLTLVLGGVMLPLDLFPDWLRPVVENLPFASVIYGPARLFVDPGRDLFTLIFVRQTAAIVVYSLGAWLIYSAAKQRIQAHGG